MNIDLHGIRQIRLEYEQQYAEHVRRVRMSFAALALTGGAHLLLVAYLARDIAMGAAPLASVENAVPYLTAICCIAPFTFFLVRLHAYSRAETHYFEEQLAALDTSLADWSADAVPSTFTDCSPNALIAPRDLADEVPLR
jgi:hypothetical protein